MPDGGSVCTLCRTDGSTSCVEGVLLPQVGFWHSAPGSPDVQQCPLVDACSYPNRTNFLLAINKDKAFNTTAPKQNSTTATAAARRLMQRRLMGAVTFVGSSDFVALPPPPKSAPTPTPGLALPPPPSAPPAPIAPPAPPPGIGLDAEVLAAYRDVQCAEGYMGALCTVCQPGYGRVRALECGKCPDKATNTGYYALVSLGQLVSLLFTVRATIMQNSGGTKPPLYGQILKCAFRPIAQLLSPNPLRASLGPV